MSYITLLISVVFAATSLAQPALNRSLRIVNGQGVNINKYPYVAAIWHLKSPSSYEYFCSGVVIRKRFLITTAQCVAGRKFESWLITTESSYASGSGGRSNYVADITVHPQYNQFKLTDNIAVIKTWNDMLSDVSKLAMLASESYAIKDRDYVAVAGFGSNYQNGPPSTTLYEANSYFIAKSRCQSLIDYISLDSGVFCFGETYNYRPGACDGDQGGPVVHKGNVVGLVSEVKCGKAVPDVATAIPKYVNWIIKTAV